MMPCGCRIVPSEKERVEDGEFFYYPRRIGNSVLICGRRQSRFPYQLFVGPEWPCMLVTYSLIIVPSVFFLRNVATIWGPAVIVLATVSLFVLLIAFSCTACSDPGIVFKTEQNTLDLENNNSINDLPVNNLIECSQCRIDRPKTASHCYQCGVCVENIDHHCPWTGKCIGEKNLYWFYMFLSALSFHILLVCAVCIYSAVAHVSIFPKS